MSGAGLPGARSAVCRVTKRCARSCAESVASTPRCDLPVAMPSSQPASSMARKRVDDARKQPLPGLAGAAKLAEGGDVAFGQAAVGFGRGARVEQADGVGERQPDHALDRGAGRRRQALAGEGRAPSPR